MKRNKHFSVLGLLFISFLLFAGCNKKEDTIAKIFVYDQDSNPVSGAAVSLYPSSSGCVGCVVNEEWYPKESTTNSAGEASFNFNDVYQEGQAGVVVIDIDVSAGGFTGQGVIKVEQETTTEEIVYIQQ
jgi:hypothetical protein